MGISIKERKMGLEAQTELGIKTAFKVVTDAYQPSDRPHYRCFFLDDEPNETTEQREYPFIEITASPNWPTHHRSTFRDIPVEIKFATHKNVDGKKATLVKLYEAGRTILDTYTNVTVTGYTVNGLIIEQGGKPEAEENEQRITLPITVKVCGA